ncbi:MAG TPA: SpoIID/LytB domain-containing protein [Mycobacteriales bacterium]|nr:SpoIID/LytB domain-containing protein [Mycobacteriales bacterium]
MRRALSLLLTAALAAGAVLADPGRPGHADVTVDEVAVRPADGVFKLEGHGWGHGRGLNQWGAQGAARNGTTYTQIVETYYPGTAMTTLPDSPIRALLEYDDELDVQVRSAAGLAARDLATGAVYALPSAPARWRITVDSAGLHLEHLTGSTWARWTGTDTRTSWAGPLQFEGVSPIRVHFSDGSARDYRGTIRGVRTSSTALQTVNAVGLEDYLRGVVPRESPASFHPEALKAQSVAARSYSAYKRAHAPSGSQADICSTTQCQVYGGMRLVAANGAVTELEHVNTSAAIDATAGQVRSVDGKPIFAEFSASNGGHSTAHAVFPYLSAKPDPWDALASPHHYWTASVTAAEIEAKYPSVGRLARIRVLSRDGNGDWGGRVRRVVLEGTSSSGAATSVESSGGGIYSANPYAGGSDTGIRGSWWRFRSTTYDAGVISQDRVPTLVKPPGVATKDVTIIMENRGGITWPVADLHLALALPPGGADPLVGGSTRPGAFVRNVTSPGSSTVAPGERAEFRIAFDASEAAAGSTQPTYRLRVGSGALFGPNVAFTVVVADPVLSGLRTAIAGASPASGEAPAPVASNGTIIVPRDGAVSVTVKVRNTGNVAWPVGGPVKLGGSGPRNRVSPSAGGGWSHPTRPAVLSGADGVDGARTVEPGQLGLFSFTVHGNDLPAGYTSREVFEPLWEGARWIGGAPVILYVVRVDRAAPRHAEVAAPLPAEVVLGNHSGSSASVVVRMRNIGRDSWPVGAEALATSPAGRTSPLRASSWPAADKAAVLGSNVSRPGVASVHPGEVGEWLVTFSGAKQRAASYPESFQLQADSGRYGPVVSTTVVVRASSFTGAVVRVVSSELVVPRASSGTAYVDIKNTGNIDWPVGGAIRVGVPSGSTVGSRDPSWLSATRPGPVTSNATRPGAAEVRPGETARFVFRVAGNNRAPARYVESFSALWEGWRWIGLSVRVSYTVR